MCAHFRQYLVLFFGIGVIVLSSAVYGKKTNTVPVPSSSTSAKVTTMVTRMVRWEVPGAMISKAHGISMAPIYGNNTQVVIAPIEFKDLKENMIVAYKNRWGDFVVHQLVSKFGKKWLVRGINNKTSDQERVTEKNLVGVVYAVFNSKGSENVIQGNDKTDKKSSKKKRK